MKKWIGYRIDRFWHWRHRKHEERISYGVAPDGSQGPPYWTCSCDPLRRYYPHLSHLFPSREN